MHEPRRRATADTPAQSGVPPPPHAVALIIIRLQVHHEECIQKITSPVRAAKHPHDTCNGRVTTQKQPPPITSSTGSSIQSLATCQTGWPRPHDPGIPEQRGVGASRRSVKLPSSRTHARHLRCCSCWADCGRPQFLAPLTPAEGTGAASRPWRDRAPRMCSGSGCTAP